MAKNELFWTSCPAARAKIRHEFHHFLEVAFFEKKIDFSAPGEKRRFWPKKSKIFENFDEILMKISSKFRYKKQAVTHGEILFKRFASNNARSFERTLTLATRLNERSSRSKILLERRAYSLTYTYTYTLNYTFDDRWSLIINDHWSLIIVHHWSLINDERSFKLISI